MTGFGGGHVLVGLAVAAPVLVSLLWLEPVAVGLAVLAAGLVGYLLLRTAHRLLGGVGGDVMGASQEIARAVVLLALTLEIR